MRRVPLSAGLACSLLLHAGVVIGCLLVWDKVTPPVVGADLMAVEIIMESPSPGGADGMQQQLIKQEEPVQPTPEEERVPAQDPIEDHNEEIINEAEIIHDAPVSKQAEFVLQQKPKPPVRAKQPVKDASTSPAVLTHTKQQLQPALENIKGQDQGQTTSGSTQMAGVQQIGLAGEIKSARYVMGSASNPKPKYPKLARKRGWQGRVILSVHINSEGQPVDIQIKQSSGHKILDRAALKALQKWTFQPARKAGMRIASRLNIPIRFDLMNS